MNVRILFCMLLAPLAAFGSERSITLDGSARSRGARLLDADLAATFTPSSNPLLRLTDDLRLGLENAPAPLDGGSGDARGGIDRDTRKVLALVLGVFIGFGTGHLLVNDRNGFILFLIVDAAILTYIVIAAAVSASTGVSVFWVLGCVGLLASHVIQGIDAYGKAGGERLLELERDRDVRLAGGRERTLNAARVFSYSF